MDVAQLDALVLRLPENVLLLSGFWPMIGAAFVVFPLDATSVCVIPECYFGEANPSLASTRAIYYSYGCVDSPDPARTVKQILADVPGSHHWRRIGYEGDFETVAASWNSAEAMVPAAATVALLAAAYPKAELVDVSAFIKSERLTKTRYEITQLQIASEISCIGLEAFEEAVDIGRSGVEIAAEVEHRVTIRGTGYRGAKRVRAYAQVSVGADEAALGYRPNIVTTSRRLENGEVALLELGLVADGYWADRTRVRVAGNPREEQLKIYNVVRCAQEAAIAALRPGIVAAEIDEAARSVIRDAGYERFFCHITGHGLGYGYHESSPILSPGSKDVLEENVLTSVEPGVYKPSIGGFRIEDDVVVTAQGPLVLGSFRKSLA
jgi:Xaa-Pro dipeptidase